MSLDVLGSQADLVHLISELLVLPFKDSCNLSPFSRLLFEQVVLLHDLLQVSGHIVIVGLVLVSSDNCCVHFVIILEIDASKSIEFSRVGLLQVKLSGEILLFVFIEFLT